MLFRSFADLYGPSIQALMDAAEVMSGDTVSEVLNVSPWWVVLALSAALVGVFVMGQKFERRSQGPITAEQAVAGAQAQH